MAQTTATAIHNLGFLTIQNEPNGYVGGYLVTNSWGRPVEFRLSSAVQPNRVQQILYGGTLQPYIFADLIGKTLVDKTGVAAQLILTDHEAVLDLRERLEIPVLWLASPAAPPGEHCCVRPAGEGQGKVFCHRRFPEDVPAGRGLLERLEGAIDLSEPFLRIREAIGEARKMGVMSRA